jgi:type VI secretion system protein ImpE
MFAQDLLRSGNLGAAIETVVSELRSKPADHRLRTFLFELLCFAGAYDRAAKQLGILGQEGSDAAVGALLYRSALAASQQREHNFEKQLLPAAGEALVRPGFLNGKRFETIEDCDPRIGSRLEVFVAGECVWVSFQHIGTLFMQPPRFLRDTIWPAARMTTGPELKGQEFGEVLLPVLYPFTWKHQSGDVKLGRGTVWDDDGVPFGQKLILLDGEDVVPYLEIRELRFLDAEDAGQPELLETRADS